MMNKKGDQTFWYIITAVLAILFFFVVGPIFGDIIKGRGTIQCTLEEVNKIDFDKDGVYGQNELCPCDTGDLYIKDVHQQTT